VGVVVNFVVVDVVVNFAIVVTVDVVVNFAVVLLLRLLLLLLLLLFPRSNQTLRRRLQYT